MSSEGIDIVYNSAVEQVEPKDFGDSVLVTYSESGIKKTLKASHILFAVGREPNSDKLGLSKAGVEVDRRGFIEVNQTVQTSQSHIYAVGDVNGEGAFTHTSVNDGEIFGIITVA
ncbi:FAD-dependent NAD(P)-disulphide oxidoreductase [Vibrio ishigakensis]|uniref:FAD-dependent NAD(P)-disulphide oxidoreductase n=1 Tax=Vibrio ishigakensis TaxID=1481914 RepID=A0A0B8QMX7_9VIBR|nr:FAD-dependent NAD(P)-disulphide oxidoreductase [Vibrio ishigakensis]